MEKSNEMILLKNLKGNFFSGQDLNLKTTLETTICVKGLKKIKRSDLEPNEDFHWIEIKDINSKPGWLYKDKPDYFIFETNDYWIVVKKTNLQELVKRKVKKEMVKDADNAIYKLYRRQGRKDLITMVKSIDLMRISTTVIDKN